MAQSFTPTTETRHPRFAGDRYDRLIQGVGVVAADPALVAASAPLDSTGLRAFASSIVDGQILDHLTDRDADLAVAVLLMDYHLGPAQIAWRIVQLLSGPPASGRRPDDMWAIVAVLAAALKIMIEALGNLHQRGW